MVFGFVGYGECLIWDTRFVSSKTSMWSDSWNAINGSIWMFKKTVFGFLLVSGVHDLKKILNVRFGVCHSEPNQC